MKGILATLAEGKILTSKEARHAFSIMMEGKATEAEITAFLMALRVRGEHVTEIIEGAKILREKADTLEAPSDAIDIVGTGGDNKGSLNISTASAFIVAGCGVSVAKHGNRAVSSKAGSADVLKALGVNLDAPFPIIEEAILKARIGFLMAPRHHSAMRHVAMARKTLGTRTLFNLLGPLANPASVKRYLIGVYDPNHLENFAKALKALGAERAWIVHGIDGFDEISPCGKTHITQLSNGNIEHFQISPEDAGLEAVSEESLQGGDAIYNAEKLTMLLDNQPSGFRTAALLNAAAALVVADKEKDLKTACLAARNSLSEGHAKAALKELVRITN